MEFRPLRRKINAITDEAALQLLKTERRGVLAVNGDGGYPYAIPVNFIYAPEENKIWFHGAKAGHKVDSLRKDDRVCFTVYGHEEYTDSDWAPHLQSVVVFGRCRMVDDPQRTHDCVRRMAMKYYPSAEAVDAELAASGAAVQLYEITIEHFCGKTVQES